MPDEEPLLLGIDAGSTTIKLVLLDPLGNVIRTSYQKHALNIKETVAQAVHNMLYIEGDRRVSVAVTGSAGMLLSEILGFPHIQEVVATKLTVEKIYPQADVVIELGGEDAMIVYLTDGVEQRMNSSCAGGTGGFLDLLSGTIGIRRRDFSAKTLGSITTYPIASRCAVFARTDVRGLLNQGARKQDIVLSMYKAIVTQTISGLACGRPIKGTVVYLGGPFFYNPLLAKYYEKGLGLTREQTIVPKEPHTFVARGVAWHSRGKNTFMLSEIENMVKSTPVAFEESAEYLSPLLDYGMTKDRFVSEHKNCLAKRRQFRELMKDISTKSRDLYLGIDAGSTTVKVVLVDEDGYIVASEYQRHRGEFIAKTIELLGKVFHSIPNPKYSSCEMHIRRCVVTGYGEHALLVAIGADEGVVETSAHLRASQELVGDVDSILDIGGQDIKYIRIVDGAVDDIVINEACSSGCGALIESFAKQFQRSRYLFSDDGLAARHPVDLGTRCTVFMTSRVRHAQKEGIPREDISAGLAYSVVRNALYKVIGFSNLDKLGDRVMVQGGCFTSDAVLAAFERITGRQALRPDISGLMGAYGCALIARDSYVRNPVPSTVISSKRLGSFETRQKTAVCKGCTNQCRLTICHFSNGGDRPRQFITGNRCEKPISGQAAAAKLPNTFKLEQDLLADYRKGSVAPAPAKTVGLTCARELFETLPFWTTFIASLGYNVVVSDFSSTDQFRKGISAIPAEGACYPSKLLFGQIAEVIERGAEMVFLPQIDAGFKLRTEAEFSCPVASRYGDVVRNNPVDETTPVISPDLVGMNVDRDRQAICDALLGSLCALGDEVSAESIGRAFDAAVAEQRAFEGRLHAAADEALGYMEDNDASGALLACHSYHVDPGLSHGIDELLCSLGFVVFSPLSLSHKIPRTVHEDACARGWHQPAFLYDMCDYVVSKPLMELIHLYSFGCGVDSLAIDTASEILRSNGKLYTGLKLDEMANLATIRIRLRSLRAAIDRRRQRSCRVIPKELAEQTAGPVRALSRYIVPGTAPAHMAKAAAALKSFGYDLTLLPEVTATSADTGLRYCNNDLCYSTVSLVGNVIEHLGEIEDIENTGILVAQTCYLCRGMENEIVLRDGLAKTEGATLPIVAFPSTRAGLDLSPEALKAVRDAFAEADVELREAVNRRADEAGCQIPIGVLGNFNLLYTPSLNNHIFDVLISEGARPVFPDSNDVLPTNAPLLALVDQLYEQGVRDIIYLQAFGCLTGNIYGSGAAKVVKKKYPEMTLTFIDYDPGVSETNQINRIKLALAIARERYGLS
ncbi:MAG: hypothetical protein HGA39_08525 [Coriobacteriia bacterium]|nr:hypothetical protein [Coriobacteriia bacterium]